jgi:DNA-binding transcriptional MerR regulator
MDEGLTIAEASARSGLSAHTLRYYERADLLLEPPPRTVSGHRRYTERDLDWLRLLSRLRATGMPIAEVARYARLARAGARTAAERRGLLLAHRAEVAARIARLHEDLALIDDKIAIYDEFQERHT